MSDRDDQALFAARGGSGRPRTNFRVWVEGALQNSLLPMRATVRIRVAAALLFTLTAGAALPQQERSSTLLSTAEIARRVTPSVVRITTPTGHGSGVVIRPSGIIATNLHVIQGETLLEIALSNGDIYDDIAVVDLDRRRDLVLLKIKAFNLTTAVLGDSDRVRVGENVVLVGSPEGFDSTVSEGVISALRDTGHGYRMLQTSAPASPGSSGGGMFNTAGELIGIVTTQAKTGQNLNFAVPVNYVRGLSTNEAASMTLAELGDRLTAGETAGDSDTEREDNNQGENLEKFKSVIEDLDRIVRSHSDSDMSLDFDQMDDDYWRATYRNRTVQEAVGVELIDSNSDDAIVWIKGFPPDPADGLSASRLTDLLQLNLSLNFAKVMLDDDAQLYTSAELELRTLDPYALLLGISSVVNATRDVEQLVDIWPVESLTSRHAPPLKRSRGSHDSSVNLLQDGLRIRYNSREWLEQLPQNDDVMKQFTHASGEAFVALIAERAEIPANRIADIAFKHAQSVDSQARITSRGFRIVNGVEVAWTETEVTFDDLSFTYLNHFFSDRRGTVQILGWTFRNLYDEHKHTIEQFVAGLVFAY